MIHEGGCHCRVVRLRFTSARPLSPRACQCGFCRRHGARSVSDPAGEVEIEADGDLLRYRFGSRGADYLICATCGLYVGALARIEGEDFATLNLNLFDDPRRDLAAAAVDYDGESAEAKAARRHRVWTPARLIGG